MGRIITVHGTFAHAEVPAGEDLSAAAYWWRTDSRFMDELRRLLQSDGGEPAIAPFEWSGDNSERDRRRAGRALLDEMLKLEAAGESYCLLAHSHGGSVVSAALMLAARKQKELPGLKRWVTVGTPFVELRRERFLFLRLPIIMKALFVASLMLFLMFLLTAVGAVDSGDWNIVNSRTVMWLSIGTALTALPFVAFLIFAYFLDHRRLFNHRPRVRQRAKQYFADRWIGLTHEDDEAVRGLGSLRTVRWNIFHRAFAVPALSLASVFILPLALLYVVLSPQLMVNLTEFLKSQVYQTDKYANVVERYRVARKDLRDMRRSMRQMRDKVDDPQVSHADRVATERRIKEMRQKIRDARDALHTDFTELPQVQRANRFTSRFLQSKGETCNDGRLCGEGRDWALNSRLLFHLVTDEMSSWFIDQEVRRSTLGRIVRFALPIILVPIVFGIVAIFLVLFVQAIAGIFSSVTSRWLDELTWKEITRSALGNDTEAEVALGSRAVPDWIGATPSFLPPDLAQEITQRSNDATTQSLGKFRNAISELALVDTREGAANSLLTYLTWNELIHTTYFDVPAFQHLVARAVADGGAFVMSQEAGAHPDAARSVEWIQALNRTEASAT